MSQPSPEQEVEFLVNMQRLLTEGQFVATYKFALLLALADIAVEDGADDPATLAITTRSLAEKFIAYYWRQATPWELIQVPAARELTNTDLDEMEELVAACREEGSLDALLDEEKTLTRTLQV